MSSDFDLPESSPGPRRRGPSLVALAPASWIGGWFTVFTAVLLANLLTAVILFLVVRAYVNHKADELRRDLERPPARSMR